MEEPLIDVTYGSGNVFADLGLPDADDLYARVRVGLQVAHAIRERELEQDEVAKILGIGQPHLSLLMRGKFNRFDTDTLLGFLRAVEGF